MLVAMGGGGGSTSNSSPSPPSPEQLQGKVNSAQTTVNQDQSSLQSVQSALSQSEARAATQENYNVRQMLNLEAEISALQARLATDKSALASDQAALNKSLESEIPDQTTAAISAYGKAAAHTPGAPSLATASSNLQSATFNEEVLTYEQANGGDCWVPGSSKWQADAQRLLDDPDTLETVRDEVAARHLGSLAGNGLNPQHFAAQEWAGETVALAELQDPQSADGASGSALTLAQKKQGEEQSASILSNSLTVELPKSGIDPVLARAALFDNGYVTTLGHEITGTMQAISVSPNETTADGIGYLYHVVGGGTFDPQLATALIATAAPTLQQYLQEQSSASKDQASQAFVFTAGLYGVLNDAQQAGVPGAGKLAGQLAQWSYAAADATDAAASFDGRGFSPLDNLLSEVLTKTQQQHVAPDMLHAWQTLSQKATSTGEGTDNVLAWYRFQTSLDGNAQLKVRPPIKSTPDGTAPGMSSDEVQTTYGNAVYVLSEEQQAGTLPAGVNPLELAAVQTQMTAGFGGQGDQVALARAMIGTQQQGLDAAWEQKNSKSNELMPVDYLSTQASATVLGMGPDIGLGGKTWSDAVNQAERGMQASQSNAPSSSVIAATNSAYTKLTAAEAAGNKTAIASAEEGWHKALIHELESVYGKRFSGDSLISNSENGNWAYLAEVQVVSDHESSTAMAQAVSSGLQASEIIQLGLDGGQSPQASVFSLDSQLASLQQPGADPGGAITQSVLSDARVSSLIAGQVSAATTGKVSDPAAALAHEAEVLEPYESQDPGGVVSGQIVSGVVGSTLTQQILANAKSAAAHTHDPLATAAPLMEAAQLSPSLTLAVYHAFDIPASSPGKDAPNELMVAAGSVHSAADYRDLAIIYGTLPDNPGTVGVASQVKQAQQVKAGLIGAFGAELSQKNSPAAQNIKNWIPASFSGTDSASAWLANDLTSGYQYEQGGKTITVGKLGGADLVTTIKGALYQATGGSSGNSSVTSGDSTVNMAAAASADGTTMQLFTSKDALVSYVAQAYGLRPISAVGGISTYDPNAVVFGQTTLGQIVTGLMKQAGVSNVDAANPIVLDAAPVTVGEQQGAEFRVQRQDGSIVWLGSDGSVTEGWAGQNTNLTKNLSTTTVQVVGGISEASAGGSVDDPLLKLDTPPPPPVEHPWWESVAKDALAVTAGIVGTAVTGNPFIGFGAALAVQQVFDLATGDGEVTVFTYAHDAIDDRLSWNVTEQFAVDTGTEVISSAADAFAPGAASWAARGVTSALTDAAGDAAGDVAGATLTTRLAAAAAGGAVQSTIQGTASLTNSTITMASTGQFTWGRFSSTAAQNGLDVALSSFAGGVSGGLLSDGLATQTIAGFGTGLGQTEVDDLVFEHHNLTGDDVLSALMMTPATTLQLYADRSDGFQQIRQALGLSARGNTSPADDPPNEGGTGNPDDGVSGGGGDGPSDTGPVNGAASGVGDGGDNPPTVITVAGTPYSLKNIGGVVSDSGVDVAPPVVAGGLPSPFWSESFAGVNAFSDDLILVSAIGGGEEDSFDGLQFRQALGPNARGGSQPSEDPDEVPNEDSGVSDEATGETDEGLTTGGAGGKGPPGKGPVNGGVTGAGDDEDDDGEIPVEEEPVEGDSGVPEEQAAAGTLDEETDAANTAVDEEAADTSTVSEEAAATNTTVDEEAAATGTVSEETAATNVTVDEEAASTNGVVDEDAAATNAAVDEQAVTTGAVDEETAATNATVDEEAGATGTVSKEVAATNVTVGEETAATDTTVDEEAAATGTVSGETATTNVTVDEEAAVTGAVSEEVTTTDVVDEKSAVVSAAGEKTSAAATVDAETATVDTADEEAGAVGAPGGKTSGVGVADDESAIAVAADEKAGAVGTAGEKTAATGTVDEESATVNTVEEKAEDGGVSGGKTAAIGKVDEETATVDTVDEQAGAGAVGTSGAKTAATSATDEETTDETAAAAEGVEGTPGQTVAGRDGSDVDTDSAASAEGLPKSNTPQAGPLGAEESAGANLEEGSSKPAAPEGGATSAQPSSATPADPTSGAVVSSLRKPDDDKSKAEFDPATDQAVGEEEGGGEVTSKGGAPESASEFDSPATSKTLGKPADTAAASAKGTGGKAPKGASEGAAAITSVKAVSRDDDPQQQLPDSDPSEEAGKPSEETAENTRKSRRIGGRKTSRVGTRKEARAAKNAARAAEVAAKKQAAEDFVGALTDAAKATDASNKAGTEVETAKKAASEASRKAADAVRAAESAAEGSDAERRMSAWAAKRAAAEAVAASKTAVEAAKKSADAVAAATPKEQGAPQESPTEPAKKADSAGRAVAATEAANKSAGEAGAANKAATEAAKKTAAAVEAAKAAAAETAKRAEAANKAAAEAATEAENDPDAASQSAAAAIAAESAEEANKAAAKAAKKAEAASKTAAKAAKKVAASSKAATAAAKEADTAKEAAAAAVAQAANKGEPGAAPSAEASNKGEPGTSQTADAPNKAATAAVKEAETAQRRAAVAAAKAKNKADVAISAANRAEAAAERAKAIATQLVKDIEAVNKYPAEAANEAAKNAEAAAQAANQASDEAEATMAAAAKAAADAANKSVSAVAGKAEGEPAPKPGSKANDDLNFARMRALAAAVRDRAPDGLSRSLLTKAGLTLAAAVFATADPALIGPFLGHLEHLLNYVSGELWNTATDGTDWLTRNVLLAYRTTTEKLDLSSGEARLERILEGQPKDKDLRVLKLVVRRYVRSNFDASHPERVAPARTRTLEAIQEFADCISQKASPDTARQARLTENLLRALGSLHGICSYDADGNIVPNYNVEDIVEHLFNRWENRLRNRLFFNMLGTYTRAMNVTHNIQQFTEPESRAEFHAAWDGFWGARAPGATSWVGDGGFLNDSLDYFPALGVEGFSSTTKVVADVDRLFMRYMGKHLGLHDILGVRAGLAKIIKSPQFIKTKFWAELIGYACYIPACAGWSLEDLLRNGYHKLLPPDFTKPVAEAVVTLWSVVDSHSMLPKEPDSGAEFDPGKYPQRPFAWQYRKGWNWTRVDAEDLSVAALLSKQRRVYFGQRIRPFKHVNVEQLFGVSITIADSWKPELISAYTELAKRFIHALATMHAKH